MPSALHPAGAGAAGGGVTSEGGGGASGAAGAAVVAAAGLAWAAGVGVGLAFTVWLTAPVLVA